MLLAFGIAAGGTILLIAIAVRVGDLQAKQQSWHRIAIERRQLAELRKALDERAAALYQLESELVRAAEAAGCPVCELRRRRGLPPADV